MYIDVSDIRQYPGQTRHFDLTESIAPIGQGDDIIVLPEPVKISLDVQNTGKLLRFNGTITGDTELTCSRCLEKYPFHLETDFAEEFCHSGDVAEIAQPGEDTGDIHVFDGLKIKIDDIINESIVLAVPIKTVCSEKCQGLCANCGINLNTDKCECRTEIIDPRLEQLKKFFEK